MTSGTPNSSEPARNGHVRTIIFGTNSANVGSGLSPMLPSPLISGFLLYTDASRKRSPH